MISPILEVNSRMSIDNTHLIEGAIRIANAGYVGDLEIFTVMAESMLKAVVASAHFAGRRLTTAEYMELNKRYTPKGDNNV